MERRTVMKAAAVGAVMVATMGTIIVATKGQTTAAQPKTRTKQAGENNMLDAQTLADRYVAVWNERDEGSRRAAIAALWVPDGQHYVQGQQAQGYEALEKRIRGSHEKNVRDNGNRFRAASDARRLHDVVTFHWEMLPAGSETVLARGLEFLIVRDDGQIVVDYQFFPA
jgi:hypothetical protein